jgi:hypothetical protein
MWRPPARGHRPGTTRNASMKEERACPIARTGMSGNDATIAIEGLSRTQTLD